MEKDQGTDKALARFVRFASGRRDKLLSTTSAKLYGQVGSARLALSTLIVNISHLAGHISII